MPTLVRPVRKPLCPVIKEARPAVQLCSPYEVGEAHSLFREPIDMGRAVAHQPIRIAT